MMRRFLPAVLLCFLLSCGRTTERAPFPWVEEHPERSMLSRWAQKEVLASCLVDDMEQEGRWTVREGKPQLSYTRENSKDGVQALRQTASLVDWEHIALERTPWGSFGGEQGGWTCVALEFPEPQDWSEWNRISLWVYIQPSKNPNVSFALDLVNATPDQTLSPSRETNLDIPQGKWVQVLWEIDGLPRDQVLRFELCQTCTGYDRAIGEQFVTIDFDRLELQKVVPDHYEGWDLPAGGFAYAHTGYRPQDRKVALAAPGPAARFTLETLQGKVVFEADAVAVTGKGYQYRQLDFSDFRESGLYRLRYGDVLSEPFPIGPDVWKEPLWSALNFYFCQRCGYPVEGIHDVCHTDARGFSGEEKKVVNGGWHDAGDLSQGFWRTAYGCYALLDVLEAVRGDRALYARVAEEVQWGLEWLLKVRFPEGRHISWSTLRYYSDGVIDTPDDVLSRAEFVPWEIFQGVAVFLKAAKAFPDRCEPFEAAAREDWEAVMQKDWTSASYLEASWGALAAVALYEKYGEACYRDAALHFGELLTACQESGFVDGMPITGYFYTDPARRHLLQDYHAAFNEAPMLAYAALSRAFPEASAPFREGARLYLDGYLKPGSALSAPYHLLPAGVFTKAQTLQQPGTPVSENYVLRTFPVWGDHIFHGATNFHLSQAWALATAAELLDDAEGMALVKEQLEWVMGRNPFSSSLMYGVGYNYAPGFVYCTRNIVGALPVGVDCFHNDEPYWNGTANATSHEIWIEPVNRFMGTLAVFLRTLLSCEGAQQSKPIVPVPFSDVRIEDSFWSPRLQAHKDVTLAVCIDQIENQTGRIRNYENAAKGRGEHSGIFFDDSDVYKALEGMAYSLQNHPDPLLEAKCDEWIDKFAAAQQPDGYINTYYTLTGLENRWKDMDRHEMYCAGHMIEAGVAYYQVTGKRKLLDVCIRMADHIMTVFGPSKRHWVPGHEEIELALVKLYQVTGEKKYLDFADWLLGERGHGHGSYGDERVWPTHYYQDEVPVREMAEISGHAVRSMYLYCGMADVASYTGDVGYLAALDRLWDDVVLRNMYITGGIGQSSHNEGFTEDYSLPNLTAYCETCASVGMVLWNWRMGQFKGDGKYADVLERALYNGALAGISLAGDRFFYVNPLESLGNHHRQEWYGCACCPSQICRFLPSIGNYVYGVSKEAVWVNLYMGNKADIEKGITLTQETAYPWEGAVTLTLGLERRLRKQLRLRIPGWCKSFTLLVNGQTMDAQVEKGYAVIDRKWKDGDQIQLNLDMPVEVVAADPRVKENIGLRAIQRGPVVYCLEEADNPEGFDSLTLAEGASLVTAVRPGKLGGIVEISARTREGVLTFIPYYAWDNREAGKMKVWVPWKSLE